MHSPFTPKSQHFFQLRNSLSTSACWVVTRSASVFAWWSSCWSCPSVPLNEESLILERRRGDFGDIPGQKGHHQKNNCDLAREAMKVKDFSIKDVPWCSLYRSALQVWLEATWRYVQALVSVDNILGVISIGCFFGGHPCKNETSRVNVWN